LDAKGVDYSARSGLNSASERTEQFQRDFLGDLYGILLRGQRPDGKRGLAKKMTVDLFGSIA
jgi:hypothetical protein